MATEPAAVRRQQRENWDRAAPGWARRRAQLNAGEPILTERLLAMAAIRPGQRVLDLACGTGDPAVAIAARVGPAGSVLGLDQSPAMVEAARAWARERGLDN